jgi:F-type H+-transporting ATPase subunit delta
MAEPATLARPYAEALFQVASKADPNLAARQLDALAAVAGDARLQQFADAPQVTPAQVFDLIVSVVDQPLGDASKNLLRAVLDNGRLAVLPEIAAQFHALVNARSGVSDATVYSAFALQPQELADLTVALERRFARKLSTRVELQPDLIGGVRVVVGDEVLDTSVKARLEQMRAALLA